MVNPQSTHPGNDADAVCFRHEKACVELALLEEEVIRRRHPERREELAKCVHRKTCLSQFCGWVLVRQGTRQHPSRAKDREVALCDQIENQAWGRRDLETLRDLFRR